MARKRLMYLQARVCQNRVKLSSYKGAPFFESEEGGRSDDVVCIYRKPEPGFVFGQDYEEYFDGLDWREVDTHTRQELEGVIYANGGFIAVGEAGTIVTSADGLNWTAAPVANATDYYGLTSAGSVAVVAGDNGTILTSADGQTWTPRPTPLTRNLHAVHYADGLCVASGRKGTLLTSPDAVTWTARVSGWRRSTPTGTRRSPP